MQWVIAHLKSLHRQEKNIGSRHGKIAGADRRYALSAQWSRDRVKQLEQAIQLLTNHNPDEVKQKRTKPTTINQLNLF